MDAFTLGWLMGALTGIPAGVMTLLTWQWWTDRRRWAKHDELDGYLERLRSLSSSVEVSIVADVQKVQDEFDRAYQASKRLLGEQ